MKAAGSPPEAGQQAVLIDGQNKIQIRLKIQRRQDPGHVNEGHTTRSVQDRHVPPLWETVEVVFSGTATVGDFPSWQDQLTIPPANITVVKAGPPVETSEVLFAFKNDVTALIQDVKNGTRTATVEISRGYSCLMDAKLVEQDPQFGLISADPTNIDLRTRIQLKGPRTPVAGEYER